MITVIQTGNTIDPLKPLGDFDQWFAHGLGVPITTVQAHRGADLPDPASVQSVVITGSPAMVSHREPWSENLCPWIRAVMEAGRPMLGVCYGHQLIAHALGGTVGPNPNGRQIGTVSVALKGHEDDPFLGFLDPTIRVQATHMESVLSPPAGAQRLGTTPLDGHHVLRFNEITWGLQFHTEFDAEITAGYIQARADDIDAEGLSADSLLDAVEPTPIGPAILRRFATLAA